MNKKDPRVEEIFSSAVQNHKKRNFKAAEKLYEEVLKINAKHVNAHNNLGVIFKELGQPQKAKNCYEKAIEIDPNYADAYNNLGLASQQLGKQHDAIKSFQKAIQINPDHSTAYNNLGNAHKELGEQQKAISCYEKAIQINPKYADAHYNLGIISKELDDLKKAINCYKKAIGINPNFTSAHNNLGVIYRELGEQHKAISCYEKAIQINPNHADAHTNFGRVLLSMYDFQKGFDEYEWRKKILKRSHIFAAVESSEWQGEDLSNKTILILSEQGIGDTIQFARYLYMLQDKYAAKVIFSTRKKLIHLFSKSGFKVVSEGGPLPKHDFHQFLCSLPRIFYKETKTIPGHINYIPKDEKIVSRWRDKLASIKGIKVGINWQGSTTYTSDRLRSIPLKCFEQLFTLEKINFINLQKGFGIEQIKDFRYKDKLYDFSSEMDNGKNAFEDTIGIMQNLDLVIAPDTSLSHLSATLGIKTWALLAFSPHWVWLLKSLESPWYESIKLYRQSEVNKWDSVFSNVKKDLVNLKNE